MNYPDSAHLIPPFMPMPVRERQSASFVWVLVAIILLGAAVRAWYLGHPMRYDESYNYLNFVARGPAYVATHYLPNNHVLHTLLVWLTAKIAGDSPMALRVPAFACGVLLIPATAWLAWSAFGRRSVALLSALGVACASALIEYSTNARGYSTLALFVVLASLAVLTALRFPQQQWRWMLWGTIGALGMYTVPIMLLPLSGMVLVVLGQCVLGSHREKRATIRGLAIGSVVLGILTIGAYLPFLFVGGFDAFSKSHDMANTILGQQINSTSQLLGQMLELWTRHTSMLLWSVAAIGAVGVAVQAVRGRRVELLLLFSVIAVPLIAAIVAGSPLPARAWLFAIPVVAVIIAAGAHSVADWIFRPCQAPETVPRASGVLLRHASPALLALAWGLSLLSTWRTPYLCCEPGGLVLIEPALEECMKQVPQGCALVAPYTPALAYYQSRAKEIAMAPLESPAVDRVYVLTSPDRTLDELWHSRVAGYKSFGKMEQLWERSAGALYAARREGPVSYIERRADQR